VLPTLRKHYLYSILIQLTPSKEQSAKLTLQSHPHPEKKALSASQQTPAVTVQWRQDVSANGDFIKNRQRDITEIQYTTELQ